MNRKSWTTNLTTCSRTLRVVENLYEIVYDDWVTESTIKKEARMVRALDTLEICAGLLVRTHKILRGDL